MFSQIFKISLTWHRSGKPISMGTYQNIPVLQSSCRIFLNCWINQNEFALWNSSWLINSIMILSYILNYFCKLMTSCFVALWILPHWNINEYLANQNVWPKVSPSFRYTQGTGNFSSFCSWLAYNKHEQGIFIDKTNIQNLIIVTDFVPCF